MGYIPEGGIYAGNLLLDLYDVNGVRTGERDVGNTKNFTCLAPIIEQKERISKRIESYGQTLDTKEIKKQRKIRFALDDSFKDNLVIAIFGEDSLIDVSASSVSDEAVTARLDKWVKLTKRRLKSDPAVVVTATTPDTWTVATAYALGAFVQPVTPNTYRYEATVAGTSHAATEPTWPTTLGETVSDGTVTWTCRKLTYVEDTDYEIDYNVGMIRALSTGAITAAQALLVDFSYYAYTGYNIQADQSSQIDAFLRLIGKNLVTNDDVEVIVHKARLKPTNDTDWITDDFAAFEFEGDVLVTDDGTWEVNSIDPAA